MLNQLFKNESFKKAMLSRLAGEAKKQGITQLLITIGDDGNFNAEPLKEKQIVVNEKTHEFLKNFYEQNKTK